MVAVLIYILVSVFIVSIISLIGIFTLTFSKKFFDKILLILVAFAAGSMLGLSFFDLIPESIKELEVNTAMIFVLIGIILFFIIERFIHWHHFHEKCDVHPVSYLILVGDGVHNFGDGVILAAAYLVDIKVGIMTTLVILFHEIPQELGDFAILVNSGFSKLKALSYNLLSAFAAIIGSLLTYFAFNLVNGIIPFLIAVGAGGFIYISTVDLLPGLHREMNNRKLLLQFASMIIGILFIYYFVNIFGI